MFLFSSNVEYSGVREFPVSNCRFQFERVEKLVFSLCRHLVSTCNVCLVYFGTSSVDCLNNFLFLERFTFDLLGKRVLDSVWCTHFVC